MFTVFSRLIGCLCYFRSLYFFLSQLSAGPSCVNELLHGSKCAYIASATGKDHTGKCCVILMCVSSSECKTQEFALPFASVEFNWLRLWFIASNATHCSHPASGKATMRNNYWTVIIPRMKSSTIQHRQTGQNVAADDGKRAMNAHSLRWRCWRIVYNNKTS